MKKILTIALLGCFILTIFTGCNKTKPTDSPEKAITAAPTVETAAVAEKVEAPAVEPAAEPTTPTVSKTETAAKMEKKAIEPTMAAKPIIAAEPNVATEPAKPEEKPNTVTFVDSLGKTITMNKNPQRVVCLHTSYLDLWDLAGGKVVGRADTKESVPEAAKNVETVGLYTTPNLEKILMLQPDFILLNSEVNSHVALIPVFEKNNIPYAALKYDSFRDYVKMLRIYTELTDREDLYQTKGVEVAKKIDTIIAKVPKDRKPSILLLLGSTKSVSVRLPDSTVGEMLQDLGTVNIAFDPSLKVSDMGIFSMEKVVEKNPDFIFVQTMGEIEETTLRIKTDIEANPAWGNLKAVKEGRYIFLPKDLYLLKPNERYAEAYEKLAKRLYPNINF
jgi:iron complex transport system substrate-binding protein